MPGQKAMRICPGQSNTMEERGRARRTITAVTGAPSAITFNMILPMRTKDNGVRGSINRVTVHAKGAHAIKLFMLSSLPEIPRVEGLELATGEMTKSLFSRSCMRLVVGGAKKENKQPRKTKKDSKKRIHLEQ